MLFTQKRLKYLIYGLALVLAARFVWLIDRYAVNIFYLDQWDFMLPLFKQESFAAMFKCQHGPHRLGLALPLLKIVYELSGWNVRADSFFILLVLLGSTFLALRLKHKLFKSYGIYDLLIPLIFLNTVNNELIAVPHLAHSFLPLFLILAYCLAWLLKDRPVRYLLVLLLNFCLIYTGFGFFMGVVTILLLGGELWQERSNRRSAPKNSWIFWAELAAILSLGAFFIDYKFIPAAPFVPPSFARLGDYFIFFINMLSSSWGAYVWPPFLKYLGLTLFLLLSIAVLFICLKKYLRARRPEHEVYTVSAILIGFSLVFMAFTAIGRISLGAQTGSAPRYATLLIPLYLGIYFYLNTLDTKLKKYLLFGYFAVILVSTMIVVPLFSNNVCRFYHDIKQEWLNNYRRGYSIEACQRLNRQKFAHINSELYPNSILVQNKARRELFDAQLKYLQKNRLSAWK